MFILKSKKNLLFTLKAVQAGTYQVLTKLKSEPEPAPELFKIGARAGAETNSFGSTTLPFWLAC